MNRKVMNRKWWLVISASLLCLSAGLLCLFAVPGWGFSHVTLEGKQPTRTFKVAILLLGSTSVPYWNSDPWILPVLNHSPFKPAGWELDNPLAPGLLPADALLKDSGDKYLADPLGKGGGPTATNWYMNGKNFNDVLTKDDPAYWVVKLGQDNLDALLNYDLLILNGHSEVRLSNADQNNIRYLLDHGATIWVNNSQRTGFQVSNLYPPIVFKDDGNKYKDSSNTFLYKADPTSWLLDSFYQLNNQEINVLRDCKSQYDYIAEGVAGYTNGENSLVQEVVRLSLQDNTGAEISHAPAIAAGRFGNGLVVASAVDLIGATSDWWEWKHNWEGLRDLNLWPFIRSMHLAAERAPNEHDRYIATTKFIFNMMNRPSSWNMAGGDAEATRTYAQSLPTPLSRGWSTSFTTLGDPVSMGDYVAVTGHEGSFGSAFDAAAGELRVYRTHTATDDAGNVQDYPLGLYTENNYLMSKGLVIPPAWWTTTPTSYAAWATGTGYAVDNAVSDNGAWYICRVAHTSDVLHEPGVGASWQTVWDPLISYPRDAATTNAMELCFAIPIPNAHWVGTPVFSKITLPGTTISATVLYALESYLDGNGTACFRPRCYLIDPYISTKSRQVGQVGTDLWAARTDLVFTQGLHGLPRASMTLSHNHLVLTTFGKSEPNSWRVYMLDGVTGDVRVTLNTNSEWNSNFRLSGPASNVVAQIDFEASGYEAAENSEAITTATYNPSAPELRRETTDLLAVSGEYFAPSAAPEVQVGQAALFLIPPTITAKVPPTSGNFSRIPPDLMLTLPGESYNIGDPNNDFRKKYILNIKTSGNILKITFRNWDVFFTQSSLAPSPVLTLPLQLIYTPEGFNGARTGQTAQTKTIVSELSMGYPVLLKGTQINGAVGQLTLHMNDGDLVSPFGYNVDAPPLVAGNKILVGTNTAAVTVAPSLASTIDTLAPMLLRQGGALNAVRLTHTGFSQFGAPMNYPYSGELAWQFFGDTLGPHDSLYTNHAMSGLNQYIWRSNFPYPSAAGKDVVYTVGTFEGYGDYLSDMYHDLQPIEIPPAQPLAKLYALDQTPSRYLQQVVTAAYCAANFPQSGYQDPQSRVTFKWSTADAGAFGTKDYIVEIAETAGKYPVSFRWSSTGTIDPKQTPVPILTPEQPVQLGVEPISVTFPNLPVYTGRAGSIAGDSWEVKPDLTKGDQLRQLYVPLPDSEMAKALQVGKRALLSVVGTKLGINYNFTWDMGSIVSVRKDATPGSNYWITFDRDRPDDSRLNDLQVDLHVATSVPYLSHVRAWNSVSGEEPVRSYTRANGADPQISAVRISEGIVGVPPAGDTATPKRDAGVNDQATMIEFLSQDPADPTQLNLCHETTLMSNGTAVPDSDFDPRNAAWRDLGHMFLPHTPTSDASNPYTSAPVQNYFVDSLSGRIQLSPAAAGEFADRFVVVHYFTNEMVGENPQKIYHADLMHVPSQVKWQYEFADAIPDSGPVLVNNVIYVTANRHNLPKENSWQPVIYAFPATPADPRNVQPLWVKPLPVKRLLPNNDTSQPYRVVTSVAPTPNGIVVGTALPWDGNAWQAGIAYALNDTVKDANGAVYLCTKAHTSTVNDQPPTGLLWTSNWMKAPNELVAYTDQGLLIADGHRVVRKSADNNINWQISATKDFDPAVVDQGDATLALSGLVQQNFTLLTRMHRLANGNILVCDTGSNRVAEFDRNGALLWQYPDSDLTYQDPDRVYVGDADTPSRTAILPVLHKPTEAPLRINGPRDVRRTVRDITVNSDILGAMRTGGQSTVMTTYAPEFTDGSQVTITVTGVKDSVTSTSFNGSFPATVTQDAANKHTSFTYLQALPNATADLNTGIVFTDRLRFFTNDPVAGDMRLNWQTVQLDAFIRWESTLIADAGNNRIIEVLRPLVRLINPASGQDLESLTLDGNVVTLARGYQYRPDLFYKLNAGTPNEKIVYLCQTAEVVADANTLALGGTHFNKPLLFTAATRFQGHDGSILDTQYDTDPVMSCVRTREVLAVVGNTVADPYIPGAFVRTVHLSRPLMPPSALSQSPQGYSLYNTNIAGIAADMTSVTVADASLITIGAKVTVQATSGTPSETLTVLSVDTATKKVTFTAPLKNTYTVNNAAVFYPEPAAIVPHPAANTINALLKTTWLTQVGAVGNSAIKVIDTSKFEIGEQVSIANMTLTPSRYQSLGAITAIDPATSTITVAKPLQQAYPIDADPTKSSVLFSFGEYRNEYTRVRQLDLVTLQNPTTVHALVVDLAGVREVTTDPVNQGSAAFNMTPTQYALALSDDSDWAKGVLLHYPQSSLVELAKQNDRLAVWRSVKTFSPTAVMRTDLGPRALGENPALYQQKVRYTITQVDNLLSQDPSTWINGVAQPRTHLFESQWMDGVGNGWAIVDGDGNYMVYPDPLSPEFPYLPGGAYPLSEPFGLDQD